VVDIAATLVKGKQCGYLKYKRYVNCVASSLKYILAILIKSIVPGLAVI
jgi:hypothetical protein